MKKYLFLLSAILCILSEVPAQINNNLVIFCNDGEKFTLILNGQKYNEIPATSVKVTGLNFKQYQTKVIFENNKLKDLNTTITFYGTGLECLFGLSRKNKKEYQIDKDGNCIKIDPEPVSDKTSDTNIDNTNTNINTNTNTNTDNTTTYTTSPNTSTNNSNNIAIKAGNLNIGLNDKGGIKVGTKDGDINLNSKDKSGNIVIDDGKDGIIINKVAKIGCASPMSSTEFEVIKKNISSQSSDTNKVMVANALLDNNCFMTSQVKEIMQQFPDDKSKLEFAKNAYPHTNDLGNYYQLKSTFKEEENKKELQKFISSQK
jgi:hypothetical protein